MVAGPRMVEAYVEPLRVPLSDAEVRLCGRRLRLRGFQERLRREYLEAMSGGGSRLVVLDAPTGAGKTLTLLIPFLEHGRGAMGVYPSRELARDQMESVARLLEESGCRAVVEKPYVRCYEAGPRGLCLVTVTSETLDEVLSEKGFSRRGEALASVAEAIKRGVYQGRAAIVFTVPEYPQLLLEAGLRDFEEAGSILSTIAELLRLRGPGALWREAARLLYRGEAVEQLSKYALLAGSLVYLDEFHSYSGPGAAAAAALVYASLAEAHPRGFAVVSSATHSPEALKLLLEAVEGIARIVHVSAGVCDGGDCAEARRETRLYAALVDVRASGAAAYPLAQWEVPRLAPGLLRHAERVLGELCGAAWRKAMVFVDRVGLVYRVAEALRENGYTGVACVTSVRRGYRHPACDAQEPRSARIIVGNEAISYGIDIPEVDAAVIYARGWSQALQRLGRVGRGRSPCPAVAYLVLPGAAVQRLPRGGARLSYQELARLLEELYPRQPEPLVEAVLRAARLRAAVFTAAYAAARAKASIDMLGSSDAALQEALARAARLLEETGYRGVLAWAGGGGVAVPAAAWPRLIGLRGGVTVKACQGDRVFHADASMLLRNFDVEQGGGCLRVLGPAAYRYAALEASSSRAKGLEKMHGSVVSLALLAEALAGARLAQHADRAKPVAQLRGLIESGALEPEQPVLILSGRHVDGDMLRMLAALGEAILVEDEKGNLYGAVMAA